MSGLKTSTEQQLLKDLAQLTGEEENVLHNALAALRGDPKSLSNAELQQAHEFIKNTSPKSPNGLTPPQTKQRLHNYLAESKKAQVDIGQFLETRFGTVAAKPMLNDIIEAVANCPALPLTEVALLVPRFLRAAHDDFKRALYGIQQVAGRSTFASTISIIVNEVEASLSTPLLHELLEHGDLEKRLSENAVPSSAIRELNLFLHHLGFDRELKWKGQPADTFSTTTRQALIAYTRSRRLDGFETYNGKTVTMEIANAILRDVAVVRDRDAIDDSLAILIRELQTEHPDIVTKMFESASTIMQLKSEGEKVAAIRSQHVLFSKRMATISATLSIPAKDAWRTLEQQFNAATAAGNELWAARVMLDTFFATLGASLKDTKQNRLSKKHKEEYEKLLNDTQRLFESLVLSDRQHYTQAVTTLTTTIAQKDPMGLANILSQSISVHELSNFADKSAAIAATLTRLRGYLNSQKFSGDTAVAYRTFSQAVDEADQRGTLLPLARLTFPLFIKATQGVAGISSSKISSNGSIDDNARALEQALAQAGSFGITAGVLQHILPNLHRRIASDYIAPLNQALVWADIRTPRQRAAFIAQIAHESGGFNYLVELGPAAYFAKYEAGSLREKLGNTQPGDGYRFRGRGFIQLTGRNNYKKASYEIYGDDRLLKNPDLAATPECAFKIAAWFWLSHNLNPLAEQGDFRSITLKINGGYNGYDDRLAYNKRGLALLLQG